MLSTTHIVSFLRDGEAQIAHSSVSEMLWHVRQYLILWRKSVKAWQKLSVKSVVRLSILRVRRIAVFLPMPGNFANSSTALSNSADEYCCSIRVICLLRDKTTQITFKISDLYFYNQYVGSFFHNFQSSALFACNIVVNL